MTVCVCVSRERERKRARESERERESHRQGERREKPEDGIFNVYNTQVVARHSNVIVKLDRRASYLLTLKRVDS